MIQENENNQIHKNQDHSLPLNPTFTSITTSDDLTNYQYYYSSTYYNNPTNTNYYYYYFNYAIPKTQSYHHYHQDDYHPPQLIQSITNLPSESENVSSNNNYFRWLEWSPDSSCILTSSNDKTMRLWDISYQEVSDKSTQDSISLHLSNSILLPNPVYDFTWYPLMHSSNPITSFFAVSMPHQPIQLYTHVPSMYPPPSSTSTASKLRSTYVIENQVDKIDGPTCIRFSNDGTKLMAGVHHTLTLFDVQRPGKSFLAQIHLSPYHSSFTSLDSNIHLPSQRLVHLTKHAHSPYGFKPKIQTNEKKLKKNKHTPLSCLQYNDSYQCLAVASYSGWIHLLDFHAQPLTTLYCSSSSSFAPTYFTFYGPYLLASHRRSGHVTCYDLRFLATTTSTTSITSSTSSSSTTMTTDTNNPSKPSSSFSSSSSTIVHQPVWIYHRKFATPQKTSIEVTPSEEVPMVWMTACGEKGTSLYQTDLFTGTQSNCMGVKESSTLTCAKLSGAWLATCSGRRLFANEEEEVGVGVDFEKETEMEAEKNYSNDSFVQHEDKAEEEEGVKASSSFKLWKMQGDYCAWNMENYSLS